MNRSFGIAEFMYIVGALRWTLLLSLVAFLGGAPLATTPVLTALKFMPEGEQHSQA